jgi:hypothetical protein
MDNATRHRRIAQRFLISILQQYGREAPAVLREWADELEVLAAEEDGQGTSLETNLVVRWSPDQGH